MKLRSDTQGIESMIARIKRLESKTPSILRAATSRIGDNTVKTLASASPKGQGGPSPEGDAPGKLADSFKSKASDTRVKVLTVQPTKLRYVTQGTGVYAGRGRIRPRFKKALWWPGAPYPMRSVKGQRANDFVKPVLKGRREVIRREMDLVAQEMAGLL